MSSSNPSPGKTFTLVSNAINTVENCTRGSLCHMIERPCLVPVSHFHSRYYSFPSSFLRVV